MYFKYGTYQHANNEIDVTSFTQERMYSKRNRVLFERRTLTLQGEAIQSTQALTKTKIQALESAYANDREDAGLYHDDGTPSPHFLDNRLSINGVRVIGFHYPKGGGAEYATVRTFRIILQAEYVPEGVDQIYSFTETMQAIGTGGRAWELIPQFQGPPIAQVIFQQTPQRWIQAGEAVGVGGYPAFGIPMFTEEFEHRDKRMTSLSSPRKIGIHKNLLYPAKWRYVFSFISPIFRQEPHQVSPTL